MPLLTLSVSQESVSQVSEVPFFSGYLQLSSAKSVPKILTKVQKHKSFNIAPVPEHLILGSLAHFYACGHAL